MGQYMLNQSDDGSSTEDYLATLHQITIQLRRQLVSRRVIMARAGLPVPGEIWEGLLRIDGALSSLDKKIEEDEHERRNLQALAEIGRVVNSSLDLERVLHEVMDTIIQLTGAKRAFLMQRNNQGDMDIVVARNWERESLTANEYEISTTIVNQVLTDGEAILTTNAKADPRFGSQESIVAYNLRSILCVPLKVKDKLTGVIYADNQVREALFTERERSILSAFADQAAVALENARLFASVQQTLAEVIELKNLMEDVFASIASGVITADTANHITLCNRAAQLILDMPMDVLLGASLSDLLPKLSPDLMERVLEAEQFDHRFIGMSVNPELQHRGPVDLNINITPLKTAEEKTRGVTIVIDDQTEKRRLEAQRRLFGQMISPAVIDQLDPDSLQLGGRRSQITVLFADLRGFTSFSEATGPETLVNVLNKYLAEATEAILSQEGTIDKFLGDAVMAWFNAPIPQSDHTLRAVKAALAIHDAVRHLHRALPEQFRLSFGIGIHSGEALLGLIGSQKRLQYTAIGDCVNTARRLQENAAGGQILISRVAIDAVANQVVARSVSPVHAEGKERPIEVYEILSLR